MSRVGKQPVILPPGVDINILNNTISKVEESSMEKSEVYVRKINFFYMNKTNEQNLY